MRRRRPTAPRPRAEALEARQLLAPIGVTANQVSSQFIFHSGNGDIHYTAVGSPVALTGNPLIVYGDPYYGNGTALPPSGTMGVDDNTTLNVSIPHPSNASETVTFTISSVDCCASTGGTIGSPTSATLTWNNPAYPPPPTTSPTPTPQETPFCVCDSPVGGTANPKAGVMTPRSMSPAGVQYGTGGVSVRSQSTLDSSGFGGNPTGLDMGWTNLGGYDGASGTSPFGEDMSSSDLPYLVQTSTGVSVVQAAGNALAFTLSGGSYLPSYFNQDAITGTATTGYAFFQPDGTRVDFYGTDPSIPAVERGQFMDSIDPKGNITDTIYDTTANTLTVYRGASGAGVEAYVYAMIASGTNAGLYSSAALERGPSLTSLSVVQQVLFTYYDGTTSNGNAGELEEETLQEPTTPGGTTYANIGTTYFRYYTTSDVVVGGVTIGYVGGLQYQLNPQSYARLAAYLPGHGGGTPETATGAQLSSYADQYYQYDSQHRVTETIVQGAGCSCSGVGQGTFQYAYTPNTNSNYTPGTNDWAVETVETLPDGTENIVYSNADGQVMLSAFNDGVDPTNGPVWSTYYQYDAAGRVILEAQPSAVTFASPSAISSAATASPDIVGYNAGTGAFAHLTPGTGSSPLGLITDYTYGISTTASTTTPGFVLGYLQLTDIRAGYAAPLIPQETLKYIANTFGGATDYFPTTSTVYSDTGAAHPETTTTSYTWYTGTDQVQSISVSAPPIVTGQNGPSTGTNNADVTVTYFDTYGRPTWTRDGDGYIGYTGYDIATGALTETIADVNTAAAGTPSGLPSGWSNTNGINLVTTYVVDGQGRVTEETTPVGNVTYTVYQDAAHEILVYPGWNATTGTTTGPVRVSRQDWAGSYSESLTLAIPTPAKSGSSGSYYPTGDAITTSALRTLSRSFLDLSGRDVEDDAYFNLSGLTYSASTFQLGSKNTNYYATTYGFDKMGRPSTVVDAVGTITITVYDALGRPSKTYVGTDDGGFWTGGGSSNMIQVEQKTYDNGGVGDGNLTEDLQSMLSAAAPDRETLYAYDWRDRLIASKQGATSNPSTEDTVTHRPITFYTLDNLGEVTNIREYDGDGVPFSVTTPTLPSSTLLRAGVDLAYDDQGRVYQQSQDDVLQQAVGANPAGTIIGSLTTSYYYDHRGDLIATYAPGGLVTKDQYDGAGRLIIEATTDGADGMNWTAASSTAGDHVLAATLTTFDGDGNPIFVADEQRFGTDTTSTGPLTVDAGTSSNARVYFTASYYDAADRLTATANVGTYGGSPYSRAASVPAGSDTVLVTSDTYNDAGWVATTTDPRGIPTAMTYDALGRATSVLVNSIVGPTNARQETDYTYDGMNHTLTVKAVDVTLSGSSYVTSNQVTTYVYGVTTSSGSATDNNDELHEVIQPPASGTGTGTEVDYYSYDAAGDLANTAHADPNGTIHTYFYDTLGRKTGDVISQFGSTSVNNSVQMILTQYNALGLVYLTTSYNGITGSAAVVNQVEDTYNGLGQLTGEYQSVSGAVTTTGSTPTPEVKYAYSEMTGSGGSNTSRLIGMTYPDGRVLDFVYNSGIDSTIGRLSLIADDSSGTPGTTLESYGYLGLNTVVEWDHPQTGINLTYLKQGSDPLANSDGGDQYTGLDRFGRVIDQDYTGSSTVRYQYGYDPDGDVLYRNDLVLSGLSELYHASGGGESNAYDGLGRLIGFSRGVLSSTAGGTLNTVASPSASRSWTYDAEGNITSTTAGSSTTAQGFNSDNQETSTSTGGTAGTAPTFDPNGNTLSATTAGSAYTYTYDAWNRLITVTGPATNVTYSYDGLGRRITEADGSGTVTDLYYSPAWQVIEERQVTSGVATVHYQYVWGATGSMVLRDDRTGGTTVTIPGLPSGTSVISTARLYALRDANGDTTAIVGYVNSGTNAGTWIVAERYLYGAYGNVTFLGASNGVPTSPNATAFGWLYLFQGGRLEAGTGLYIFEHRDYNPTSDTWMERDPLGMASGDTNLYRFVQNDPTNSIDPTGLQGDLRPQGEKDDYANLLMYATKGDVFLALIGLAYIYYADKVAKDVSKKIASDFIYYNYLSTACDYEIKDINYMSRLADIETDVANAVRHAVGAYMIAYFFQPYDGDMIFNILMMHEYHNYVEIDSAIDMYNNNQGVSLCKKISRPGDPLFPSNFIGKITSMVYDNSLIITSNPAMDSRINTEAQTFQKYMMLFYLMFGDPDKGGMMFPSKK